MQSESSESSVLRDVSSGIWDCKWPSSLGMAATESLYFLKKPTSRPLTKDQQAYLDAVRELYYLPNPTNCPVIEYYNSMVVYDSELGLQLTPGMFLLRQLTLGYLVSQASYGDARDQLRFRNLYYTICTPRKMMEFSSVTEEEAEQLLAAIDTQFQEMTLTIAFLKARKDDWAPVINELGDDSIECP